MAYKYVIAADFIREKIFSRTYKPGEKLPSVQRLSKELSYNSDTIVKAYKLLEDEHLIYASPKSGYYVVKSEVQVNKKNHVIDMVTASPPDSVNPYRDFYHCMEKAISLYEKKLFEYCSPQGMQELINVLAKHMANFQVFTKPNEIFITNGSQQALYILAAIPFPNGRTKVLVEQPTYSVMLQVLKLTKTPVVGIGRTHEGIDLSELEAIFKRGDIKFFYTMPRYQNPTGFCYNSLQKKEIINLAKQYEVYIVEDDYLADLEVDAKADPMYAIGDKERIIYIRSFSKALLPGLRLGMAIVPKELQNEFFIYKRSIDLNSPILTQGALEIYLQSSMYKFHVQRTKQYYQEKMEILREACIQNNIVKCYIPPTGIYACLDIDGISSDILVDRLAKDNVLLNSTTGCYIDGFPHPESIQLCVCKSENEDIKKVIQLISHKSVFKS
ncbi:transcriptional regulator with HTH domain and aminotransferase domain [Desulfosporosinus orientis DSM 765]|uniref:Transcriptional regulator with HTH domain and aminotransferase domain n=1 Tax=Desulfosporosinus orientis (strain ATCC 19365 / DSM 765 / NCIMB 8382 / VKM B-1628 / Singapore I) TaxID=768706 RepID=G7W699_DESOD|nr:PLP-dependent aminotransferase family protein [Desulfosporosinus orientis]AET68106.1 transcriptional regulator with HTH domain and aminotransferase domain [Desulfosporosinus orientis DSM 765]